MPLRQIAPGVHVHERPLRFFGLELGARMTVLSLEQGLLLYSPTDLEPAALQQVGTPRWCLSPNKFHHLFAGPWIERGVEGWCGPGLPKKRADLVFSGVVTEESSPFGDEVLLYPLTCFPFASEVVALHRPSHTLVVSDLFFNIGPSAPTMTKAVMCGAGGYPGCKTTLLERVGMNRPAARRDVARLLELDFDRVIVGHGDIVDTGGKQALRSAFSWLGSLD